MRRLWKFGEVIARGKSRGRLRWAEHSRVVTRIIRGVYGEGQGPPTALDRARATVLRADGVGSDGLAGVLHGLDGVTLGRMRLRRRELPANRVAVIGGIRVTTVLQTLTDLAASLSDDRWEQALESALRKKWVTLAQVKAELARMSRAKVPGTTRVRRVLELRGDVPATDSLLETLMVQLIRTIPELEPPLRQVDVYTKEGVFVARVDLAWPHLGVFIELDGQQHRDQPIYDAYRETAVVAATGWLVGRFTWHQVTSLPGTTGRQLVAVIEQAKARPLAS